MMNRGKSAVAKAMMTTNKKFQDVVLRKVDPVNTLRAELEALDPMIRAQ
jgi:hypothetical protein